MKRSFEINSVLLKLDEKKRHSSNIVYLGCANNYKDYKKEFKTHLSDYELERAAKFLKPEDELTYICSHYFLRKELASINNLSLTELKIEFENMKKPFVVGSKIDFSLSHSKNNFAFGLALKEGSLIGVDIEEKQAKYDYRSTVEHFFHLSEKEYVFDNSVAEENRLARFYTIWTRKEAFLKMLGVGLVNGLNEISVVEGKSIVNLDVPVEILSRRLKIYMYSFETSEYVLSIASNEPVKPCIKKIESCKKGYFIS